MRTPIIVGRERIPARQRDAVSAQRRGFGARQVQLRQHQARKATVLRELEELKRKRASWTMRSVLGLAGELLNDQANFGLPVVALEGTNNTLTVQRCSHGSGHVHTSIFSQIRCPGRGDHRVRGHGEVVVSFPTYGSSDNVF